MSWDALSVATLATVVLIAGQLFAIIWLDRRRAPRIKVHLRLVHTRARRIFVDYFLMNHGPIPAVAVRSGVTAMVVERKPTMRTVAVGPQVWGAKASPGKLHRMEDLGQGQNHLYGDVTGIVSLRQPVFLTVLALAIDRRLEVPFFVSHSTNPPTIQSVTWRRPVRRLQWRRLSKRAAKRATQDYA